MNVQESRYRVQWLNELSVLTIKKVGFTPLIIRVQTNVRALQ